MCAVGGCKSIMVIDEGFGKSVPILLWVVDPVKASAVAIGLEPGQVSRKLHFNG